MNNLARNTQFEPALIVTRKVLVQTADRFMASAVGFYSQDEVFEAVAEIASAANPKTLIQEVAWAVTREVIKRRTTPHLSNSNDWVGYGDVAITLPERKIVNIYYADMTALEHRKNNVIENFNRVKQAMDHDLKRIDKLQTTMLRMAVNTAGPAIDVLSAIAE